MLRFRVELRGARRLDGSGPVSAVIAVRARNWEAARGFAARRYGVDPFDPSMLAIEVEIEPAMLASAPRKTKR